MTRKHSVVPISRVGALASPPDSPDALRRAVRLLAEQYAQGASVPVLRETLLEVLAEPAGPMPEAAPYRLLTPTQVAKRLGVGVGYVYHNAHKWPFRRKLGRRVLRFSEAGLEQWLARRPAA